MAKDPPNTPDIKPNQSVAEELDAINASLRQQGAQANRRRMEAAIDAKAKQRRRDEKPLSSGFKKP